MTSHPPTFDPDAFLRRFWRMDRTLVEAGFPAISPWWRTQIERFIRALARGQAGRAASIVRRWVIRAGRRAGKSTTLARLSVAWAWFGPWFVPKGDVGVIAFVSTSKDEAGARLRTIAALLDTLGLSYLPRGDELELLEQKSGRRKVRSMLFRVYAATTRAVVGFTSIMVVGDECARWESRDTAANPAAEVIGSLMPTLATQPFGFCVLPSSPWGSDDYHATLFALGDTNAQVVSHAPTWIANPTITEAQTHDLEPDERLWSREYAAEPGATVTNAFDPADAVACFEGAPRGKRLRAVVTTDPSSLRGDDYTYMAGYQTDQGEIEIVEVHGWNGEELRSLSMADVVKKISERARVYRVGKVYADQREEAALRSLFAQQGLDYASFAWTETSKDDAVMVLRRLMRERKLFLPDHPRLRRELTTLKAHLLPSGRVRYASNGLDYASALITLAHDLLSSGSAFDYAAATKTMNNMGFTGLY